LKEDYQNNEIDKLAIFLFNFTDSFQQSNIQVDKIILDIFKQLFKIC